MCFNEVVTFITSSEAPVGPGFGILLQSFHAASCALNSCHSLSTYLLSGRTRCSKFILSFIGVIFFRLPFLQGALVHFSGEWYLEAKI